MDYITAKWAYYARKRNVGGSSQSSRLPGGYKEYRYFYRNNPDITTYIDTGLNLSSTMTWELSATLGVLQGDFSPIGTGNTKSDSNYALWIHNKDSRVSAEAVFGNGNSSACIVEVSVDTTKVHTYKMVLNTGQFYIDGVLAGTASSVGGVSTAKKLIVSGCWRGSQVQGIFKGWQGETLIRNNGVLARDYVPCLRISDDKPGMYDLVSGAFQSLAGENVNLIDSFTANS